MSVINKIRIDNTVYDIEDSALKAQVEELEEEVEVATNAELLAALYS